MVTTAGAVEAGKSTQKESKKAANQMNKEGWKIFGKAKSMKEALDAHYKALNHQGMMTLEGHAIAKDINLAVRKSQYNAATQYATMQETKVEGTTTTKISNSSGEKVSSNIEMESRFQTSTDQIVKSLTPTVVFYRTLKDGRVEVRSLYVVKCL